ncbi:MAG: hypothetical protein M3N39_13140, partial [Pseudomonadota bacterium]|nr:hypothetical protein [Pseudomonadota bacterium]
DGKLYLTLAVLEYDPKHPKIRKEHEAIIEDLHVHLKKGAKSRAVHFPSDRMTDEVIGANTVGPGPAPGRPKR